MLARPKRFELLTPRFVVWCSIQLSYGRMPAFLAAARAARRCSCSTNACAALTRSANGSLVANPLVK